MRPIQQFTLATASVLALSFAPASLVRALPLTTSDSMTFVTEDQSLWGPGTEAAIQKPFSAKIIDIDTGSQTIGEIAELSTSIPNPGLPGLAGRLQRMSAGLFRQHLQKWQDDRPWVQDNYD